ncbi:hypothetical protein [Lysobacter sp. Root494]|uniref:hypothetical protein n=1 Tax=Lysobacter sp. Root494 TaxID=1736549 RepID=UPI000700E83D|nr:hypothetical protein [Lysobacter sp. Root494]KQY54979.1 hypothetical protein ASD14_02125 [Lysobacter sp. Root494]
MNRFLAAIALACAVPIAHAQHRLEIVAYPVTKHADSVTGTFKVRKSADGIESIGTGGACLVADLRASGIGGQGCTADSDCSGDTHFPGSYGYCLRPARSDEAKACWIRPGSQVTHCHLSPTTPVPLDRMQRLPVVAARPLPDGKPVRWMVLACLNGGAGACKDPGRTDVMKSPGRARTIP